MREASAHEVRALAEATLSRADAARDGLEELLAAVERLRAALGNGGAAAPAEPAPAPSPEPAPARVGLDAARLIAIEMAMAGRSRDEVERHLRVSYGGPDTSAVLADVFGDL